MIVKTIGGLMVLGASTAAGFIQADALKKRTRELNELQRAVNQLQNEMAYINITLPEAFSSISQKSTYPLSQVFKQVSTMLELNEVDTVFEAMDKAMKLNRQRLSLNDDDVKIMMDMSKTLGECDMGAHMRVFDLVLENLKKQTSIAETAMMKNSKMYRFLGFSLGAAVVIMLI